MKRKARETAAGARKSRWSAVLLAKQSVHALETSLAVAERGAATRYWSKLSEETLAETVHSDLVWRFAATSSASNAS